MYLLNRLNHYAIQSPVYKNYHNSLYNVKKNKIDLGNFVSQQHAKFD